MCHCLQDDKLEYDIDNVLVDRYHAGGIIFSLFNLLYSILLSVILLVLVVKILQISGFNSWQYYCRKTRFRNVLLNHII